MLKARVTLAASALALLSLTGCASQLQLSEQNRGNTEAQTIAGRVEMAGHSGEFVEFSIASGNREPTATMQMGTATTLVLSQGTQSGECNFKRDFGGTPGGTPVDVSLTLDASSGMAAMIFPTVRTAEGVKAFISVSKQSAQTQEWAEVRPGCKLPVGKTSAISLRTVEFFKWGAPTKLKLSDGSVVVITAIN